MGGPIGIFWGLGYIVMTAEAKKDQFQLTVPILRFLNCFSWRLRGNLYFVHLALEAIWVS